MAYITPRKCIQSILLLAFVIFIVINLHFLSPGSVGVQDGRSGMDTVRPRKPRTTNLSRDVVSRQQPHAPEKPLIQKRVSTGKPSLKEEVNVDSSAQRFSDFNESLRFIIDDINKKQTIRNSDKFPPVDGTYRHAWVIQVHNRDHYLKYLINSLRETRGIESSLLIVSHDYYCKEMFDIITNIDFMPVMQIFYPKAMQLYKKSYPGEDPSDCPRNIKKPEAVAKGCVNAEWPDKYGHYREAAYAQTKLHWFWKLHQVFDGLDIMKNFTGYITLIEEDHFVTKDSLHMLNKMLDSKASLCSHCRIFTLGNYDKKPTYAYTDEVVAAPEFISSKHNMAMSMNRETYTLIKSKAKQFCDYDDYNWDWSLQYIGHEVIPGKLPTLIVKTPRVYHIGDCGVHHKGKQCNPAEKASPIKERVSANEAKLFPQALKSGRATSNTYLAYKKLKANGGWGDKRDHDLCASFME
ncbi:alpha-1,6-mannosyl-glycoprotein 2-beta-N-acetylglucosaminyltransferase-like [Watersipora subatra]|uniref:alpha-1,6-mannosyl-glycoprotein 2-beta-N-acetylglucosaminyltransferase-like n=1 Tax=Watersipora subatra TaxID=2589382 RepID=UPI00355C1C55